MPRTYGDTICKQTYVQCRGGTLLCARDLVGDGGFCSDEVPIWRLTKTLLAAVERVQKTPAVATCTSGQISPQQTEFRSNCSPELLTVRSGDKHVIGRQACHPTDHKKTLIFLEETPFSSVNGALVFTSQEPVLLKVHIEELRVAQLLR